MAERKKLDLELNKKLTLELLFDECMKGSSKFGEYFLYSVKNGSDAEFSFFAPDDVHEKIKELRKGDRFEVVKLAEQKGSKIVTRHEVNVLVAQQKNTPDADKERKPVVSKDTYYEAMLISYQDALRIQEQLNGMVDVNRIAITLFIARSKINNGNSYN